MNIFYNVDAFLCVEADGRRCTEQCLECQNIKEFEEWPPERNRAEGNDHIDTETAMKNLSIVNKAHGTSIQFEPNGEQILVTMGADMNSEHALGVAMWLSKDEARQISEWLLSAPA